MIVLKIFIDRQASLAVILYPLIFCSAPFQSSSNMAPMSGHLSGNGWRGRVGGAAPRWCAVLTAALTWHQCRHVRSHSLDMLLQCGMCRHVQTCGHVGRGTSWQTHTHQFPVVLILIKLHVSAEIKRHSNNIVIVTATFVHPELILLLQVLCHCHMS